jgi:hypothetical protein
MEKLRLDLDDLRIESFEAGESAGRGTVRGRGYSEYRPCETEPYDDSINYCSPAPTAAATCAYTCGNSCGGTCGCGVTQGQWSCVHAVCTQTEPYVE